MTKINQAKLIQQIVQQDRRDSKKKWYNIHALPIMLKAAEKVTDTESFMDRFTPTRSNNSMARKLGLGLDVKSGRWVMTEQINEAAVDGTKLIELLIMALQEGDTVRFNECVNKLLSYKVSECLSDQRQLLACEMFEVADLVRNANTDRKLEPDDNDLEPDEEGLSNNHLTQTASMDDQSRNFEEGSESDGHDTFRERAKPKSKKSSSSGQVGY